MKKPRRGCCVGVIVATIACGRTSDGVGTTEPGGSGGSAGAAGSSGAGGTGAGGNGSGGSIQAGAGGSASPGTVSIEFTVGAGSYCHRSCQPGSTIEVRDASGRALSPGNLCTVDCTTCTNSLCPPLPCLPDGAVTGAHLDWDGRYYAESTCGSGTSCVEPAIAPPGKYTATFCATPGTLTGPDGGFQQCVTSGPAQCGSVQFDFPSTAVVKGTIGP